MFSDISTFRHFSQPWPAHSDIMVAEMSKCRNVEKHDVFCILWLVKNVVFFDILHMAKMSKNTMLFAFLECKKRCVFRHFDISTFEQPWPAHSDMVAQMSKMSKCRNTTCFAFYGCSKNTVFSTFSTCRKCRKHNVFEE